MCGTHPRHCGGGGRVPECEEGGGGGDKGGDVQSEWGDRGRAVADVSLRVTRGRFLGGQATGVG